MSVLFFKKKKVIYFLAMLDLCRCMQAFCSCEWGLLSSRVVRASYCDASLVTEPRLQVRGL